MQQVAFFLQNRTLQNLMNGNLRILFALIIGLIMGIIGGGGSILGVPIFCLSV